MSPSTVVIGAGLSGLTAAYRLAQAGRQVVVVESRDRVGGRTLTTTLAGEAYDLGAQWVGPHQRHIHRLLQELGLRTFPQATAGAKVLELGGRLSRYRGTIPSLGPLALLDLQWAITRLEGLARRVPPANPLALREAPGWDWQSVADWLRRSVRTPQARGVLTGAVRAIFAAEPEALSFLYFLFYLRANEGLMRLADVRHGAQQDRVHGGAQAISHQLAERLSALGGEVRLRTPAHAIRQSPTGAWVETAAGAFAAGRVIVATPPPLAAQLAFAPALPADRQALLTAMPMGSVIKCIAHYARPFWRAADLTGEALSDASPVRLVFDDSAPEGGTGALVGFLLGETARAWSGRPAAERRAMVLAEFARFFGPEAGAPLAYVDQDWTAEAWSLGCYASIMAPQALTRHGFGLRRPFGRVHWAGTETARVGVGYLDGAVEAGERAAAEVLAYSEDTAHAH